MGHGGKRPGAGRKPKFTGDKTIAMRVPQPLKPVIDEWLQEYARLRSIKHSQGENFQTLAQSLSSLSLPLFASRVPAGSPTPGDESLEAAVDLNTLLVRRPESSFMVTVKGDSMRNAAINDGDMLIVDRALAIKNGKIVVAVLNGELTVKRLEINHDGIRLLPENPDYQAIRVDEEADFFIWGTVTQVIHKVD